MGIEIKVDVSSVANNLIDKISSATSYIFKPSEEKQSLEMGKAKVVDEISKLDINVLDKMAMITYWQSIKKEYVNKTNVIQNALNFLDENANPDEIDNDWLSCFFDKVKNITDAEMQMIWGKILSEEAYSPNSISRRLLHSLSIMSKETA